MTPAAIVALLQALLAIAPQIPEVISAGKTAIGLITSGAAPTPEQQATIDAGLDAANKALQNS